MRRNENEPPARTVALRHVPPDPAASPREIRRLYPPRDDALPLYVQDQGAFVGKTGSRLVVKKQGRELGGARLKDINQLVLCGNIGVSAQTIHLLCKAGIPIVHLSMGHWFYGITHGITLRNAFDRAAQFETAGQPARCLSFALVRHELSASRVICWNTSSAYCVMIFMRNFFRTPIMIDRNVWRSPDMCPISVQCQNEMCISHAPNPTQAQVALKSSATYS